MSPVFSLAMVTICLACYSNWFKNRVDGYLWRCFFWSPIILMICVARQVRVFVFTSLPLTILTSLPTYIIKPTFNVVFPLQVTQSYLPRVVKPTPPPGEKKKTPTKETKAQ